MKTYLFRFQTNYGEAGIIIVTSSGLEWAKGWALKMGAWDVNDVEEINAEEEHFLALVNFKI